MSPLDRVLNGIAKCPTFWNSFYEKQPFLFETRNALEGVFPAPKLHELFDAGLVTGDNAKFLDPKIAKGEFHSFHRDKEQVYGERLDDGKAAQALQNSTLAIEGIQSLVSEVGEATMAFSSAFHAPMVSVNAYVSS